jgi:hypothetical protein
VDQDIYACGGGELTEGGYDGAVCKKVAIEVSGFDIKYVYENTDIGEDVLALLGEVVFHESILAVVY